MGLVREGGSSLLYSGVYAMHGNSRTHRGEKEGVPGSASVVPSKLEKESDRHEEQALHPPAFPITAGRVKLNAGTAA